MGSGGPGRRRTRRSLTPLWGAVAVLTSALVGCVEWLELPDPDASSVMADAGGATSFEAIPGIGRRVGQPASVDAGGPLVPRTPGLRVPSGYWTRARLDDAEITLPYTWAVLDPVEGGVLLRAFATGEDKGATVPVPSMRVTLGLALPDAMAPEKLEGLELTAASLTDGLVAIVTSPKDTWLVEPSRLLLTRVDARHVEGVLEGDARRGAEGRVVRPLRAGFRALRSPDPVVSPRPVDEGADALP